ncbi:hypothetical protein BJV77DRAFT_1070965 [Russula vinacea]|nr:hypothetical protein BJV77DRAFT_1070965 [Russula vinacea]
MHTHPHPRLFLVFSPPSPGLPSSSPLPGLARSLLALTGLTASLVSLTLPLPRSHHSLSLSLPLPSRLSLLLPHPSPSPSRIASLLVLDARRALKPSSMPISTPVQLRRHISRACPSLTTLTPTPTSTLNTHTHTTLMPTPDAPSTTCLTHKRTLDADSDAFEGSAQACRLNTRAFAFEDSKRARRGFNMHTRSRAHAFKGSTPAHSQLEGAAAHGKLH